MCRSSVRRVRKDAAIISSHNFRHLLHEAELDLEKNFRFSDLSDSEPPFFKHVSDVI